jgi:hypothetical protein
VNARKEPVPKAPGAFDPHIFAPNLLGPKDYKQQPLECLHCPMLRWNGVHVTSEELVADLPPTPPEVKKLTDRILGEA